MAVYFRHGSNGAYKSAYAVWFEILPALRQGRLVVTNIEGLKPLETIESILGEKFPVGAQLIRIFSRSENGVMLWQNWFNWMPTGALVIIDECQDLYTTDVGFKREKALQRPVEEFFPFLPDGFSDLFHSRWTKVDLSTLDDGDTDDTGGTQVDEEGRLLYPFNFYGAFMRHRKYQWDIIMLTPDWTAIPSWLRGCAQEAYSHRSTDTFFRKRKPRIFNHLPTSTKTRPSTKSDYASCSSKKIPVDVFALYKSTGTGGFNESKSDISILKSPKFIGAMLLGVLAIGNFLWDLTNVLSDSDENQSGEVVLQSEADLLNDLKSAQKSVVLDGSSSSRSVGVADGRASNQDSASTAVDAVNPFFEKFRVFNGAQAVYVTGVNSVLVGDNLYREFIFRIDKGDGHFYISSEVLSGVGYDFVFYDECLVSVETSRVSEFVTCPPNDRSVSLAKNSDKNAQLKEVDIFNLSNDGA